MQIFNNTIVQPLKLINTTFRQAMKSLNNKTFHDAIVHQAIYTFSNVIA